MLPVSSSPVPGTSPRGDPSSSPFPLPVSSSPVDSPRDMDDSPTISPSRVSIRKIASTFQDDEEHFKKDGDEDSIGEGEENEENENNENSDEKIKKDFLSLERSIPRGGKKKTNEKLVASTTSSDCAEEALDSFCMDNVRSSTNFTSSQMLAPTSSAPTSSVRVTQTISRPSRATFTQRTSLEEGFVSHMRILVLVQCSLLLCGVGVSIYVFLRLAFVCNIDAITDNPSLRSAMPNITWHCFLDYAIIRGVCGVQVVLTMLCCFTAPELKPTRFDYVASTILCGSVFFGVSMAIFTLIPAKAASLIVLGRAAVFISIMLYLTLLAKIKQRRLEATASLEDNIRFKQLTWSILKFGLIFFIGFYAAIILTGMVFLFAKTLITKILGKVIDGDDSDVFGDDLSLYCKSTACAIPRAIIEMIVATMFFSVYLPLWGRYVSAAASHFICLFDNNPLPDPELSERAQLGVNFIMDCVRFTYGRGVLFALSSQVVFVLMVFKDNTYNFWHFAIKYTQSYIVLTLKIFFPGGGHGMNGAWNLCAKFIEYFVRCMGIPKRWAICWIEEVDFRETKPGATIKDHKDRVMSYLEPETPVSIAIGFANMKVTIRNLPLSLGRMMQDMLQRSQSRRGSVSINTGQIIKPNPNLTKPKPKAPARRGSVTVSIDMEELMRASQIEAQKQIAENERREKMLGPDSKTTSNIEESRKLPGGNLPPVTNEERILLCGLTESIQSKIFRRYQTRILSKFYSSYLFIFIPGVAAYTDSVHTPGFIGLDDKNYLTCGLVFVISDFLEWLIITFGVFMRGKKFHTYVAHYRLLIIKDRWIMWIYISLALYTGIFMFQSKWDPFKASTFIKTYPEEEGTLIKILEHCSPKNMNQNPPM